MQKKHIVINTLIMYPRAVILIIYLSIKYWSFMTHGLPGADRPSTQDATNKTTSAIELKRNKQMNQNANYQSSSFSKMVKYQKTFMHNNRFLWKFVFLWYNIRMVSNTIHL